MPVGQLAPEAPSGTSVGWLGGMGLSTLFLIALAFFWAGLWMQSCSARRAAQDRARARALAAAQPVTVSPDSPDRANDGRLVHVTGALEAAEPVADPLLGIAADALALERDVEIYEWGEASTAPSPGLGPRRPAWSSQRVPWEGFDAEPDPPARPRSARFVTAHFRLGAFRVANIGLPRELTTATVPLALAPESLAALPGPLRRRARLAGHTIHVGDPAAPRPGDLRIRYSVAPTRREVTVVAGQDAWGLAPFFAPGGESIAIVKAGRHQARDLLLRGAAEAEAGMGAGYVLSVPLFVLGAVLAYWPVRAAGRVLPGLAVLVEPGPLLFIVLGSTAVAAGAGSYARWAQGGGVGWPALVAVAAAGTLVVVGSWRRERRGVAGMPPVAAPAAVSSLARPANDAGAGWYHLDRGHISGPFTLAQLIELAWARLPEETVVWGPSTGHWTRAVHVPPVAAELTRRSGGRLPDPAPTLGGALLIHFVTWPYHFVRDALQLGRQMRGDRPFSRSHYVGCTVFAGVVLLLLAVAAFEVLDFRASPAEEATSRRIALLFALLALVLPAVFMVRASALRLRDIGQSERRAPLILVPGLNLLLWWQLVSARGAADPAAPKAWTPVIPPPARRPPA